MKPLYLLGVINVALIMSGCATNISHQTLEPEQQTTVAPAKCHVHKDPLNVSVITKEKPARPYTVIGKARVSKYNVAGNKRQEATMRDIMRQLAASLNGDAVIEVQNREKEITATVITYQPIIV
jgi:uncharacterized protein YceK